MADESEFVHIRMSGDDNSVVPGRVTRAAFEMIWKGRGFVIVDDDEAALAMSPETQAEIADTAAATSTRSRKG